MQLAGRLLKVHYPKWIVIRVVEHIELLFFNDFSKIPIVNQMVSAHKMICIIFGSGIYHKPHFILKSKSQEFHNINIGIFSVNETRMVEYFIGPVGRGTIGGVVQEKYDRSGAFVL